MSEPFDPKAWRARAGLSQEQAATVVRVKRPTWAQYERGRSPCPAAVIALALAYEPDATPAAGTHASPTPGRASKSLASKASAPGLAPAIAEALKRKPLFARTSAEAKAMRRALADEDGRTGHVPLIELRPLWRSVGLRDVNAAIPDPISKEPPERYRPRGVLTASGAVYDCETAHRMSDAA